MGTIIESVNVYNQLKCFIAIGLVNVKWDSAQGSHSCSFDVEWLKEFDYSTPDVLKKKAEGLAPIVTVRNSLY